MVVPGPSLSLLPTTLPLSLPLDTYTQQCNEAKKQNSSCFALPNGALVQSTAFQPSILHTVNGVTFPHIVHCSKASMAYFPLVTEQGLWILLAKVFSKLWVFVEVDSERLGGRHSQSSVGGPSSVHLTVT